jgi:hypothetical protein
VAPASGTIGVFFDPIATICSAPTPAGTRLYIVAALSESMGSGIAGGEFRVQSSQPGAFFFSETPEPGWIQIGSVFGDGATMASSCGAADPLRVVFLTATAYAQGEPVDVQLLVERHRTPSNASYTGPMLILCDAPTYTAFVAGRGFPTTLNPTHPGQECQAAPIGVQERTWGAVKEIYRDATR